MYKVRNRSGNVILTTESFEKVAKFLNVSAEYLLDSIEKKLIIDNRYTVEHKNIKKVTNTLEQTTAKMVDNGYGVNYGKYQVDKARWIVE